MSMDLGCVAAHEFGHVYAARAGGLRTGEIRITDRGGHVIVAKPEDGNREQVAASQVVDMAGQAALDRWCRETGQESWDSATGDRAIFRSVAHLPGAIPMGTARRRAEAIVNRHWGAIRAHARSYTPKTQREESR